MQAYKTEISEEEKEQIIKEFLPYIKYMASRLSWRLPPHITADDLVSSGLMGLMDALDKFEQGRVKLKTYAEFRIKGSMLDEIRAADWVPRSAKKKANDLKNAIVKLEKEFGRAPEDEEVADALEVPLEEYYKVLQDASSAVTFRLDDFDENASAGDRLNIMECISDPNADNPLNVLEHAAQKQILAKAIDGLPEKEKLLLSLYYWEELTMKEIGKVMKLTEGRVCQLHSQALIRLKARMDRDAKETA